MVNDIETIFSWYLFYIPDTECESDSCPYDNSCSVNEDNDVECDCDETEGVESDCEGKIWQMIYR